MSVDLSVEWIGDQYHPLAENIKIVNAKTMSEKEKLYNRIKTDRDILHEAVIYTGRLRNDLYCSRKGQYAPYNPQSKTVFPLFNSNNLGDMENQFGVLKKERQKYINMVSTYKTDIAQWLKEDSIIYDGTTHDRRVFDFSLEKSRGLENNRDTWEQVLKERNLLLISVNEELVKQSAGTQYTKENNVDENPDNFKYETDEEFKKYTGLYKKLIEERDNLFDQLKRLTAPPMDTTITSPNDSTDESDIEQAFKEMDSKNKGVGGVLTSPGPPAAGSLDVVDTHAAGAAAGNTIALPNQPAAGALVVVKNGNAGAGGGVDMLSDIYHQQVQSIIAVFATLPPPSPAAAAVAGSEALVSTSNVPQPVQDAENMVAEITRSRAEIARLRAQVASSASVTHDEIKKWIPVECLQ
jgi:hypothetical protein